MDTGGSPRLNRWSRSCLNRLAQRTDYFHGLLGPQLRSRTSEVGSSGGLGIFAEAGEHSLATVGWRKPRVDDAPEAGFGVTEWSAGRRFFIAPEVCVGFFPEHPAFGGHGFTL